MPQPPSTNHEGALLAALIESASRADLARLRAVCEKMQPPEHQVIEGLPLMAGMAAIDAHWLASMWRSYPHLWARHEVAPPQ